MRVHAAEASKTELVDILKAVDDLQRNSGDRESLVYIEQSKKRQGRYDLRSAGLPPQR